MKRDRDRQSPCARRARRGRSSGHLGLIRFCRTGPAATAGQDRTGQKKREEAVQGKGEASLWRPASLLDRTRRSTPQVRSPGGPACPESSGRTGHRRTACGWGSLGPYLLLLLPPLVGGSSRISAHAGPPGDLTLERNRRVRSGRAPRRQGHDPSRP